MSLINDALKKAQRERTAPGSAPVTPPAGTPPATPPPAAPAPAYATHPAPRGSNLGMILGVAAALVIGGGAVWWVMRPSAPAQPPVVTATAPAPAPHVPTTTPPAPAPVLAPTPTVANATPAPVAAAPASNATPVIDIRFTPPAPTSTPPTPVPVVATPPPAAPVTVAVQPTTATPLPTAPARTVAVAVPAPDNSLSAPATVVGSGVQDPRVLAFLDAAHVGGIRPSMDDPRLLMNNRVFRQGDLVDRPLKLRLTKIVPGKLTFIDERGTVYEKEI